MFGVADHVLLPGSYRSPDALMPELLAPPVTSTFPFVRSADAWRYRLVLMLGAADQLAACALAAPKPSTISNDTTATSIASSCLRPGAVRSASLALASATLRWDRT